MAGGGKALNQSLAILKLPFSIFSILGSHPPVIWYSDVGKL
jgi:hypothetical protein